MEIYLVRHTPVVAQKGLCYGQTDLDIQESFHDLFANIKTTIGMPNFEIYSSPLKRCRQLAEYLSDQPVTTSDSLMEINFGDWENRKWDDIDSVSMQSWMVDFVNAEPPNGESFKDMFQRIKDFIETVLLPKEDKSKIVIVTHAGVVRCFLCYILDIPLINAFKIPVEFSGVTKINLSVDKAYNVVKYFNKA